MRQFQNLDISVLVDALAEYSEKYYNLLSRGGPEKDIIHCRITIHHILREINSQKDPRYIGPLKNDPPKR